MAETGMNRVAGHTRAVRQLKKAVESGRVSHAYLFTGDPGCGKRTLADLFAAALLCEDPDPASRPCMKCPSCRKAAGGNHPDLIHVTHEKQSITVDDIRTQLISSAGILPYEGGRKVFIVPEAEKMNAQAQNALLKTIEEPPSYAVILLLSANPAALLPTVLSRCLEIKLLPLPDRIVEEYVREELRMPDYEAKVIAAFAQGNIGRARLSAENQSFSDRKDRTLTLLRRLKGMNTAAVRQAVRDICADREGIGDVLGMMLLYMRDVLYYKASGDGESLVFTDELTGIREKAGEMSFRKLSDIVEEIELCRSRLASNVNAELAVELLLTAFQ